jgi:hypothetical protein
MARTAPVAASSTTTAPWVAPAATPGPASSASNRDSAAACQRASSVVRSVASVSGGTSDWAWSALQSANQPGAIGGVCGNAICAPACFACTSVSAPLATIAASTSRPRAAAAWGSLRGLKREGARGSPASTAACHSVTCLAETPK